MRESGDQVKTACGNLQLCAVLKAGIEGATHAVGQRILERVRAKRGDEEEATSKGAEEEEEDGGGGIAAIILNLTIETAGTEEEAKEGHEADLGISTQEMEVEGNRGREGEEEGRGNQRALGALELLTQEAETSGTTLLDDHNGFNELRRLAMLWTVRHRWPTGVRFAFNCYRHWAQLLLRHPGEPPVTILNREGITQGEPLSMVLYGITLAPLAEELRAAYPGLLYPFYADDAAFSGLARQSAQLLKLLMKRGPDRGYFPEPAKSLFILDNLGQEKTAKQAFSKEGLVLNFVRGIQYLGA